MGVRIDKLLRRSPYHLIQEMMSTTNTSTFLIPKIFGAIKQERLGEIKTLTDEISNLEMQVDEIKREIRNQVTQSLFFPFPKRDFLELIFSLDSISDNTELLGKIASLRLLEYPGELEEEVNSMAETVLKLREYLSNILMVELNALVEASFSGPEAQAVLAMIDGIGQKAHTLEVQAHAARVVIFAEDSTLGPQDIILWNRVVDKLEAVGLALERSANNLRLLMEK